MILVHQLKGFQGSLAAFKEHSCKSIYVKPFFECPIFFFNSKTCILCPVLFVKMVQSQPRFVYFRSFLITIQIQIENAQMSCLGIEPRAAKWQVQTDPLSYGVSMSTTLFILFTIQWQIWHKLNQINQSVTYMLLCTVRIRTQSCSSWIQLSMVAHSAWPKCLVGVPNKVTETNNVRPQIFFAKVQRSKWSGLSAEGDTVRRNGPFDKNSGEK